MNKNDPSGLAVPAIAACAAVPACAAAAVALGTATIIAAKNAIDATKDFINSNDNANEPPKTDSPEAPKGIVGENPRPARKPGGRVRSDGLAPEHGGTGDADDDFDVLTGGNSAPPEEGSSFPEGSRVGENDVIFRPGTDKSGPRIDIPKSGEKPRETLHYPKPELK